MKKQVIKLIKSLGGVASYSGKTKTMFINSPSHIPRPLHHLEQPHEDVIMNEVLNVFGYNLPFKLAFG